MFARLGGLDARRGRHTTGTCAGIARPQEGGQDVLRPPGYDGAGVDSRPDNRGVAPKRTRSLAYFNSGYFRETAREKEAVDGARQRQENGPGGAA